MSGVHARTESEWLIRFEERAPDAIQLICFPYAGGSGRVFASLARRLPAEIEVHAVELPGRAARLREPPLCSMEDVVRALTAELAPLTGGPYALYGTSMGALVAYEVARALRRSGTAPALRLFAVAARAPHATRRGDIHRLPPAEFQRALGAYGGTPAAVLAEPELLELMMPMVRADFTVTETYMNEPEPPLEIPIVALGGREDPIVPLADLSAWREHTRDVYTEELFPGNHFFHRESWIEDAIARLIGDVLLTEGAVGG